MKRLILFFVLVFVLSCKKGGGDVAPEFDSSLVAGTWKLQALSINPSETGVWGKDVTDLLAAYRQQIGDDCINNFRMTMTSAGKLSQFTSNNLSIHSFTYNTLIILHLRSNTPNP